MRTLFAGLLLWICVGFAACTALETPEPAGESTGSDRVNFVSFVDPFIGTQGTAHTFPGPSMPFGMVQPGPDNASTGWAYTSGYQYEDTEILGFSQNRASGTGIPELGDVLVMPSATRREDFASGFDKASESARPGYYAVTLDDNEVCVELTAGDVTAFHRYTFEEPGRVWVYVDLQHGLTFGDDRQPVLFSEAVPTANGLEGTQRRKNWTTRTVAFSLRFDEPVVDAIELPQREGEMAQRFVLAFDLEDDTELIMKAGLSTVDVEGARANREAIAGWDFDAVAEANAAAWEDMLSRIQIDAPDRQKTIFYTAMYHAFLHPSRISDVDGRWRGPDGEIRQVDGGIRYSTLSLWDTFRAAHPLYTIVMPERVDDFVLTMLDHHDAFGRLPLWTIWGGETGTMIGEPAIPVIVEAWAKGFRGFDGARALDAMVVTSTEDNLLETVGEPHFSTWSIFDRYGYYPFDVSGLDSVSRTLEAGIGDDAVARMAELLGEVEMAERFRGRSGAWKNLMDPETKLARGRDSSGEWRTPFKPLVPTSPLNNPGDYTEANAWQYTWTPGIFDAEGLIEVMGGEAEFKAMLDTFFFDLEPQEGFEYLGQEAMIGQYAHGNEPSHHIAWLYKYTSSPETGQALVRQIAESFYDDTPTGIKGNEDAGQLSSWYIFATLGFYPVDPVSAQYVLGKPLVERAVITLANGETLTIEANGANQAEAFSPAATLDGQALGRYLIHEDLTNGGMLSFDIERAPE